jgi:DNA-binding MarR family transcriptional regulator
MEALDLIVLGRQLTRIGERAMRGEQGRGQDPAAPPRHKESDLPPGTLLVMRDVFAHPGSSITDITARTGLPQGYVSESVIRLRERGMAETTADPADGRRRLVSITGRHLQKVANASVTDADTLLLTELGTIDDEHARQVIGVLSELADRLRPARTGSVVGRIRAARSDVQQDGA